MIHEVITKKQLVKLALAHKRINIVSRMMPDGTYYDEFNCLWKSTGTNVGQIKGHPLKKPSLTDYQFPDPDDPSRVNGIEKFLKQNSDKYTLASLGNHTLIERAFNLRGMTEFMMDIY